MSNLTRFEPVREMMTLREAMDRLFDDAFTHPISMSGGSVLPPIDMFETANEVVVKATLPGMKAEDVQISVTGDIITLRGEFKSQNGDGDGDKNATYHVREHRYGTFERTIRLPSDVQSDKARAEFENGILTVSLPKSEAVKPKIINIKTK
jgi:HSP20 family protein